MFRPFSAPLGSSRGPVAFGISAVFSLFLASCLGVLDVGDYAAVPESLCSLLDRCQGEDAFPGCRRHVAAQLELADVDARENYLKKFADCLDDCQRATVCLDEPPLCRSLRQTCGDSEQCCGFSTGNTACTAQTCCAVKDAPCENDVDCCNGACSGNPKVCQGPSCRDVGDTCASNADCCNGSCVIGLCMTPCAGLYDACAGDSDCCSQKCGTGSCRKNDCVAPGAPCLSDADCCEDTCDTKLGICGTIGCFSEGVPCSTDSSCCAGLLCNPADQRCAALSCTGNGDSCLFDSECCGLHCSGACQCAPAGTACISAQPYKCCSGICENDQCVECLVPTTTCTNNAECCSGVCSGGTCCNFVGCSHSVCTIGGALSPKDCTPQNVGAAEAPCIDAVCAQNPACCCDTWDQNCVDQVLTACSFICPAAP